MTLMSMRLLAQKSFPEWPFAPVALLAAWFYLRYLMWFSHPKAYGDHSADFLFANLFPMALRPVVSALGGLAHNLLASLAPGLRLRQPEEERPEAVASHDGAVLWNMAGARSRELRQRRGSMMNHELLICFDGF